MNHLPQDLGRFGSRSITAPQLGFGKLDRAVRHVVAVASVGCLASMTMGCAEDGSGVIVQETHEVAAFDTIAVDNGFSATIVPSDEFSVVVFADDNFIDDVHVSSGGDQLHVWFDKDCYRDATLEVEIGMPLLSSASLNDGSSLHSTGVPLGSRFRLTAKDGSSATVSGLEDDVLSEVTLVAKDGSSIQGRFVSAKTSVEGTDGSSIELKGRGDGLRLVGKDGSSLETEEFSVEYLLVSLVDGSFGSATVETTVEGSLKDGSHLRVSGGAEVDVSTSDGSSVDRR